MVVAGALEVAPVLGSDAAIVMAITSFDALSVDCR
jgi:hypothetical protein